MGMWLHFPALQVLLSRVQQQCWRAVVPQNKDSTPNRRICCYEQLKPRNHRYRSFAYGFSSSQVRALLRACRTYSVPEPTQLAHSLHDHTLPYRGPYRVEVDALLNEDLTKVKRSQRSENFKWDVDIRTSGWGEAISPNYGGVSRSVTRYTQTSRRHP